MGNGTKLEMYGGRLVVAKHASGGAAAARLGHEAECLRRCEHPGVVELVDTSEQDDGTVVVRTAFVGGGTLAEHPPDALGPDHMIQVTASVASTLADLHQRGIIHGRVSADHVLVADGGGAVLCGFAEAAVGGSPDAHRTGAATDVAAVGALIRELTGGSGVGGAPELHAVAGRALADDPSGRPSMRALVDALVELAGKGSPPPASVPAGPAPIPEPQGRRLLPRPAPAPRRLSWARRDRPRLLVVGTVAGAAMALALTAVVASGPGSGGATEGGLVEQEIDAASGTALVPATTTAVIPPGRPTPPSEDIPSSGDVLRVWPPSSCPVPTVETVADIDGDGCDEEIEVDGAVVRAGDRRWAMGGPNDVVVVGNWDCDDRDTPSVLRPGSGQIWRFPRWAAEGEEVTAVLVATVPGAVDATVAPTSEGAAGCDQLDVLGIDGAITHVVPAVRTDRP